VSERPVEGRVELPRERAAVAEILGYLGQEIAPRRGHHIVAEEIGQVDVDGAFRGKFIAVPSGADVFPCGDGFS
jgi:hypothetical protein